jgi:hypothetical protein
MIDLGLAETVSIWLIDHGFTYLTDLVGNKEPEALSTLSGLIFLWLAADRSSASSKSGLPALTPWPTSLQWQSPFPTHSWQLA